MLFWLAAMRHNLGIVAARIFECIRQDGHILELTLIVDALC
jgi:hypothetical protein